MTDKIKPMLAGKAPKDLAKLNYPVLVSPKFDGIRVTIRNGKPVTRTHKDIPNSHISTLLTGLPDGLDGEILTYEDYVNWETKDFNGVQSDVMSRDGKPVFIFWIFDWDTSDPPGKWSGFEERLKMAEQWLDSTRGRYPFLQIVPHLLLQSQTEVEAYEAGCAEKGWEGIMLRDPDGIYKHGRSTTREGWLLKLKRWADEEATIIGFEEQMHNENELQKDEFGNAKRSSAKGGLTPAGTLGAFICQFDDGTEFRVAGGPGFTAERRQRYWDTRLENDGKTLTGQPDWMHARVKIKYQPNLKGPEREPGQKPRIPQFLGFRKDL